VVRRRRLGVAAVALGLLAVAAWGVLRQPSVSAFDAHTVEVRFDPWGEDGAIPPGAKTADPEAVAALVGLLRSGVAGRDHKCGSRGVITLRRSLGGPVELDFLPGHHFRYADQLYRVPRAEFVAAMRRVGVEVPLECQ